MGPKVDKLVKQLITPDYVIRNFFKAAKCDKANEIRYSTLKLKSILKIWLLYSIPPMTPKRHLTNQTFKYSVTLTTSTMSDIHSTLNRCPMSE